MCRTAALLFPIWLLLTHNPVPAQELTLTVELIIFDCMACPELFAQFSDGASNRREVAMKLRQEAAVKDSVKSVQLITVGKTVMQISQVGSREIRVLAKSQPPTEDGRYPVELGMSCVFPQDTDGLRAFRSSTRPLLLRLNEPQTPSYLFGSPKDQAGNITERYIVIWFATLAEGRPDEGEEEGFLEIRPRHAPPAEIQRPKPNAKEGRRLEPRKISSSQPLRPRFSTSS